MRLPSWFSLPTAGAVIGTGLVLAPIAALIVAWTGLYNIAASHGHPQWLNWFLELGMRRSVEANARELPVPDLADQGLVQLGAAHFQGGCAPCHAAPGELINPIFDGMLPSPPRLESHAADWRDHELHWIVRHGLQYAGMPSWSGAGRGDEVWAMVAFLRRLKEMSPEDYIALARGNTTSSERSLDNLLRDGVPTMARTACDRCHDTRSAAPVDARIPRLGGQSEAYLVRALTEYRSDIRQSGFMEPVAAQLDEESVAALAAYYSSLASPRAAGPPPAPTRVGQRLAIEGDRTMRIPACVSCHVGGRPAYPRLAGQSAIYIETQLRLFRSGGRSGSEHARVMTGIAKRLSDKQVADLAAFFASLPTPSVTAGAGGAR